MLSLLKLFQSIPKKILLLIVIGMGITALDGIVIPYFISNLIEVGTSKNVSDLVLISIVGILGYGFVRFGVFIWDEFQQRLLKLLTIQTKEKLITNPNHVILKAPHPSPLSAYRGFFGSKPFSRVNDILIQQGQTPIRWKE